MITTFDDIVNAITDMIERTPPLLRNKELFCAAAEKAFFDADCKNVRDVWRRIEKRVKDGMKLMY